MMKDFPNNPEEFDPTTIETDADGFELTDGLWFTPLEADRTDDPDRK